MTVCIGLIHRGRDGSEIIACTDGRLDHGDYGSSVTAEKVVILGYGWFAMLSGSDWVMANEMALRIGVEIRSAERPKNKDGIIKSINKALRGFRRSPFHVKTATCDLIVAGFLDGDPLLLFASARDGSLYVSPCGNVATVGSGSAVAQMILTHRNYRPDVTHAEAVYMAYEAKRFSEKVPSVGPETWIETHYPVLDIDSASIVEEIKKSIFPVKVFGLMKPEIDYLEECYKRFGLQSITLGVQQFPQYPTADSSDQQPSPESPGGSDES